VKQLDVQRVPLSGVHLIEASAGTGKTHALTTLYLRAVVELGLLPEQILVVTFTRAATGELRERIRTCLRNACVGTDPSDRGEGTWLSESLAQPISSDQSRHRLERALSVIDQAAVTTIHGFCAAVLEQNAFESRLPLGTELLESIDGLLDEVVNDFIVTRLAESSELDWLTLRSIGLGTKQLRSLGQLVVGRDDCALEPEVAPTGESLYAVRDEFERHRRQALEWLREESHLQLLAGLNKTKPAAGLGKRVEGYLAKVEAWLVQPVHRLEQSCPAFERLFELGEKNPAAKTAEVLDWFSELRECDDCFRAWRRVILENGVRVRRQFVEYLRSEIEARKAARDIQTYDDLLRRLRDALTSRGGDALIRTLRERYPLALIDEFQDTDPVQFEVFARIYAHSASLFLIGDPKQSIYAFRGADVENYLVAKRDPRVECHTLDVNWRSDSLLVAGVEKLYRSHPDPFVAAGIDYVPVVARPRAGYLSDVDGSAISGIRLLWLEPEADDIAAVTPKYRARKQAIAAAVTHIRALLATSPRGWGRTVRASEIAVLARTNRECQLMAKALRTSGIRCVQTSASSVLFSEAARSLATLLRALLSPNDSCCVTAWLVDELVGFGPSEVDLLRDDADGWEGWIARLLGYRRIWERAGLLAVVVRLCDELQVKPRLLDQASGERFITDLFHVAELAEVVAKQRRLTLAGVLDWLVCARAGEQDCSAEDQQLRTEADSQAVLLTTVHRSKGLEFPFVLCPFLWDGGPKPSSDFLLFRRRGNDGEKSRQVIDLEPELLGEDAAPRQAARAEQLRENARLLYVALTRAKHQVALVWSKAVGFETSPLYRLLFRSQSPEPGRTDVVGPGVGETRAQVTELEEGGAIVIEDGVVGAPEPVPTGTTPHTALAMPAALQRIVLATVQTTSYSALTATASDHAGVGRDVDSFALTTPPAGGSRRDAGPHPPVQTGPELPLVDLPGGSRTGEALHQILERADFERFATAADDTDVSGILERFGLDAARFTEPVRRGLRAVLDVELQSGDGALRLGNVSRARRCSELEFSLKVAGLSAERLVAGLRPDLTGLDQEYARDVARLRFDPVTGYLRGFIDLVFEYGGRFYVVDYKSNALGCTADCYGKAALCEEMRRHHYPVQAAIYAAAVDGWLRLNQPRYEYESDFGGIFYLFLRGMLPVLGDSSGVFFHRPSAAGLREFQAMLAGEGT
jgi:exodeoxyribonuclease V beta subunit